MKTLTTRALNRALLARQLLLERAPKSVTQALEAVGGLQTQNATGGYIGLWTRLQKFELGDLTRALEERRAVQGTIMRITIHLVSAADYPLIAAGTRPSRRAAWIRYQQGRATEADVKKAAAAARRALAKGPLSRSELKTAVESTTVWNGVNALDDVLRVPPSGTWARRRADAASWAGVPPKKLEAAAGKLRLRTFEEEEGTELLDLPRAPLPSAGTPAPARFLPVWDAILLAPARRAEILPEEYRPLVFSTKTPQSVNTFLVDGVAAGTWRVQAARKQAELVVEPFEKLPAKAAQELEAEGERLVRFHEPGAEAYSVRLA